MEMMPQNANQLTFRRDRAGERATCPPAISVGPVHVIHPRFPSVASVVARAEQRAVHERRAVRVLPSMPHFFLNSVIMTAV